MEYKTHQEFFDKCGDQWLHPKQYGECIYSCTVEEMYQHFKARLAEELVVDAPDLRVMGRLVEMPNVKVRRGPTEGETK